MKSRRIVSLFLLIVQILFIIYHLYKPRSVYNSKTHHKIRDETSVENQMAYTTDLNDINIGIIFKNAKLYPRMNMESKFETAVFSMIKWTTVPLNIYVIADSSSYILAENIIKNASMKYRKKKVVVIKLEEEDLAKRSYHILKDIKPYFINLDLANYQDSIFFISIVMHKLMPDTVNKIIMLDCDIKLNNDIMELHKLFDEFSDKNIIGIARENQPAYRHVMSKYRKLNPGTRIGEPPPDGITGFNTGVLLLNLDKMRKSNIYNFFLNPKVIKDASKKYSFRGHLADQDFFFLLCLEHEELFHILSCSWNRQLCTVYRDKFKEYTSVFDLYFNCKGHINIYHGNCGKQIPKLEWEE